MKNTQFKRRGFTLVELLVVIVIIASLAGLTAPMVIRQRKKADQTEAVNNARQIGLALFEFETEYASYPDANTANEVPNDVFTVTGAADSNSIFTQLFAAQMTQSEEMFYAKIDGVSKPDGDITAARVLEAGENAFSYIMEPGEESLSSGGNPSRILVATPLVDASTFDPDPFDSKAVVLRIDNSVSSVRINAQDEAVISNNNILDPTASLFWGDSQPTVILPDYK